MSAEYNDSELNSASLTSIVNSIFTLPIGAVSIFTVFNRQLITIILTSSLGSKSLASVLSFIIFAIGLLIIIFYATILVGSLGLFFLGFFIDDSSLISAAFIIISVSAIIAILSTLLPFHPAVAFYITSNLIVYGISLFSLGLSFVLAVLEE